MTSQLVPCPHCDGSGWIRAPSTGRRSSSTGRRGRSGYIEKQMFESSVAALSSNWGGGSPSWRAPTPEFKEALSPGEKRRSTLYHQWSTGDVWVSGLIAGVSGLFVGVPGTIICIAARTKWYWPLLIWTVPPVIMWGLKVKDFFVNDKAVISSQEQERRPEPAPIVKSRRPRRS